MGKPGTGHAVSLRSEHIGPVEVTRETETSQYPEEEKATAIPLVAASERGPAQPGRACTPGVVGPRHGSTTPSRSGLERPATDGDSPVGLRVRPLAVSRVTRDTCNPA